MTHLLRRRDTYNTDHLFRRLGLPRNDEVNSEIIFRLVNRIIPEGSIDRLAQHIPAGDGGAVRVHLDTSLKLLMPMPHLNERVASGEWQRP